MCFSAPQHKRCLGMAAMPFAQGLSGAARAASDQRTREGRRLVIHIGQGDVPSPWFPMNGRPPGRRQGGRRGRRPSRVRHVMLSPVPCKLIGCFFKVAEPAKKKGHQRCRGGLVSGRNSQGEHGQTMPAATHKIKLRRGMTDMRFAHGQAHPSAPTYLSSSSKRSTRVASSSSSVFGLSTWGLG